MIILRILSVVLFVCSAAPVHAESVKLKLATSIPDGTVWHRQLMERVNRVKFASGGEIQIDVFPGSQLGGMGDTLKNTLRGRIDMWSGTIPAFGSVNGEYSLLSLPYLFESGEEFGCVIPQLLPTMQDLTDGKFTLLSLSPLGTQSLAMKREVRLPEDVDGIKIRVAPVASIINFFASIGAVEVPLDPAETVVAISSGVVSGVDTSSVYYMAAGINRIAPVFIDTRHVYNILAVVVSNRAWQALSDEQKALLEEEFDVRDFETELAEIKDVETALLQQHVDAGGTIVNQTADERAIWVQAGRASWNKTKDGLRGDIDRFTDAILEAKAECN
ncbi:MAG: ABC transporter substrate-binding protein [Rhizobiaceae bacterium MnEN-MB40S]|nr:MAG: ABC transporter substrate-binding protein [Rhizobiaceae bacterium MnEN-MB40S]